MAIATIVTTVPIRRNIFSILLVFRAEVLLTGRLSSSTTTISRADPYTRKSFF
jgi:hypothetical protein